SYSLGEAEWREFGANRPSGTLRLRHTCAKPAPNYGLRRSYRRPLRVDHDDPDALLTLGRIGISVLHQHAVLDPCLEHRGGLLLFQAELVDQALAGPPVLSAAPAIGGVETAVWQPGPDHVQRGVALLRRDVLPDRGRPPWHRRRNLFSVAERYRGALEPLG